MYGTAFIFAGTLADEIKHQHFKNVYPKGITRTRTALDSLMSVERKEAERNEVYICRYIMAVWPHAKKSALIKCIKKANKLLELV